MSPPRKVAGDFVRQLARPLGPSGPHRRRRGLVKRARKRSRAEQEIHLVGAEVGREFGVQRRRLRSELEHVADDRDATPLGSGLGGGQQRQRRAHRSGIGVVAFVDDGRRTIGHRQQETLAPALLRREKLEAPPRRPQDQRQALPRRAARQARSAPCGPGRAEFERQFMAKNARPYARAAVDRLDAREAGRHNRRRGQSSRRCAPRDAAAFCKPLELRSVAIQDRRSVRLEAEENLGFRIGDRFDRAEMLDVDGRDHRHERACGRAMRVSGAISPA